MFCCKPDMLCYFTVYLEPSEAFFQEEELPPSLADKFSQQTKFLYLPKTMYFPPLDFPYDELLSKSSESSFNPEYELTFSDETRELIFKQLVPNPSAKIWRVLLRNEEQPLKEGDQFAFDGLTFQLYHLPKQSPTLSSQVTYLTDSEEKCRICFGNDTTEINPLLNFCNCSGSIKYMHLECCREWLQEGAQTIKGPLYAMHVFYNPDCNICKQPWKNKVKNNKKEYLLFDFEPRFAEEDNPFSDPSESFGQSIIFILTTNDDEYASEENGEGNYVLIFKLRLPEVVNQEDEFSFRIGESSEECDIIFEHMILGSPIQCEFKYKNNKLWIKDMNSNEGTGVFMKNSIKKSFEAKKGLFFRYLDEVYHVRGEKYLFSCFESNQTYSIKYEECKQGIWQ